VAGDVGHLLLAGEGGGKSDSQKEMSVEVRKIKKREEKKKKINRKSDD